jgi:predicted RNase H-like HicB family nuclease
MTHEDYKTVLYRQDDGSWVAEIPAIPGCYALMTSRDAALAELAKVFALIAEVPPERAAFARGFHRDHQCLAPERGISNG